MKRVGQGGEESAGPTMHGDDVDEKSKQGRRLRHVDCARLPD